jgi:DNA-binding FadR family transcriptional regulator
MRMRKVEERRNQGLHRRVICDLGQRIVSGEFAPASPLPAQEQCCALLGVSRSVLREALRVLAAKGLVHARPKAGTYVTSRELWNFLDPDIIEWRLATTDSDKVIQQLYELRQMVEPVAAALAASRAKLDDFRRIGQAFEEMDAADGAHIVEPDLRFHRAIIRASGNDLLVSLGRVVESALSVTFRIGTDNPQGQSHSLKLHKAILDAIVDRDSDAARLAMQTLIDYSKQTVRQIQVKGSKRPAGQAPSRRSKRPHSLRA